MNIFLNFQDGFCTVYDVGFRRIFPKKNDLNSNMYTVIQEQKRPDLSYVIMKLVLYEIPNMLKVFH
jgi:hypothetical protein